MPELKLKKRISYIKKIATRKLPSDNRITAMIDDPEKALAKESFEIITQLQEIIEMQTEALRNCIKRFDSDFGIPLARINSIDSTCKKALEKTKALLGE